MSHGDTTPTTRRQRESDERRDPESAGGEDGDEGSSLRDLPGRLRERAPAGALASLGGAVLVARGVRRFRDGARASGAVQAAVGGFLLRRAVRRRRTAAADSGVDQTDVVDTAPDIEDAVSDFERDATGRASGEEAAEVVGSSADLEDVSSGRESEGDSHATGDEAAAVAGSSVDVADAVSDDESPAAAEQSETAEPDETETEPTERDDAESDVAESEAGGTETEPGEGGADLAGSDADVDPLQSQETDEESMGIEDAATADAESEPAGEETGSVGEETEPAGEQFESEGIDADQTESSWDPDADESRSEADADETGETVIDVGESDETADDGAATGVDDVSSTSTTGAGPGDVAGERGTDAGDGDSLESYDRLGSVAFDAESNGVPAPQEAFDREFLALGAEAVWGVREADDAVVLSQFYDAIESHEGMRYVASTAVDSERTITLPSDVLDHWDDRDAGGAVESGDDLVFATSDDLETESLLVVVPETRVGDVLWETE